MKFQSISVDSFGALSELEFSDFDQGLSVIFGSNGSGKTTLLSFLRGVFCGYSESHRIGLLPPASGEVGGGSIQGLSRGERLRLTRSAPSDRLQTVSLADDAAEQPHSELETDELRTDLFRDLFTASGAEGHNIDKLVSQALADEIPMASHRENPVQLHRAAAEVHHERSELLAGTGTGRLADLAEQRRRVQAEMQGLTEQLRHRCEQWESQFVPAAAEPVTEQIRVTWLRNELAAAQCDLREAEDLAWSAPVRPPALKIPPRKPRSTGPFRPPHRQHITVRRIPQLERLDRQIDHARSLLAEAAQARLKINLRAARIAGSEDISTGPFLRQMRDSLASLEAGVLEYRDNTQSLGEDCEACGCDQWESSSRAAVREFSQRIYQLCEQLTRYELNYQKSILTGATATIDQCEQLLHDHLESLCTERSALLQASPGLRAWSAAQRSKAEQDQCRCLEHDVCSDEVRSQRSVCSIQKSESRQNPADRVRPSQNELDRLHARCEDLRCELETAVVQWRAARQRRPSFSLPKDIQSLERQIDEKRIALRALEADLAKLQQRWRVLSVTGEVIRRLVQRFEQNHQSDVIQWASEYLSRLTTGRFVEVCVAADDHALTVIDADGTSRTVDALSRGTLDQLDLSLRLALVRAYGQRSIQFPLVLDDVLVDTDQQRLRAAVDLLREFAEQQDLQIIYLTCQSHLAELFERHGTPVRTMPGSTRLTYREVIGRDQPAGAIRGWVDRKSDNEVVPAEPTTIERPTEVQKEAPAAVVAESASQNIRLLKPLKRRQPDGPYWLSVDAPVDLVPSIGSQMGRRLAGLGIATAGDLIDLDPNALPLRLASLQITPERLSDWQAEAELLCCVPDLTGPAAQLLVTCGIHDPEALSQADVDQLLQQISDLTDSEHWRSHQLTVPNRDVVRRWILSSRRARDLRDARRFSHGRGRKVRGGRRAAMQSRGGRRTTASRAVRSRSRRVRRSLNRPQRSRTLHPESPPQHDSAPAIITPFVPVESQVSEESDTEDLRFYLGPHSPVVDAPSIGPTTSRRLEKIGVLTVADLLNRDAEEIATRLKNRRIREETVRLWQQQARLMCRIPQLRGHDAHVLIACGITEPEQLANMSPSDLFALVDPFVETKEGQRLLRSNNTPDLEEVTHWIQWAAHSRHLRAA